MIRSLFSARTKECDTDPTRQLARNPASTGEPTSHVPLFSVLLLFVLIGGPLGGCRQSSKPPQTRYELKGKTLSVDRKLHMATIAHEAIPGFMGAMTMTFPVKDEEALSRLEARDQILAILVVEEGNFWLENLVITKGPSVPGNSSLQVSQEPEPGSEVPDFQLVNQNGKAIHFHQYRGSMLLLTFVYTRCPLPGYCPLMSRYFNEIKTELLTRPDLHKATHLLSISLDPPHDTPAVLKKYGSSYTRDFDHWEFAVPEAANLKSLASWFGLSYWEDGDQIIHSLRTAFIDPEGRLFKLYKGNEWKPEEVIRDLETLRSR